MNFQVIFRCSVKPAITRNTVSPQRILATSCRRINQSFMISALSGRAVAVGSWTLSWEAYEFKPSCSVVALL
jgi:hypothetical protein